MAKIIGLKDLRENTENYIAQVAKGRSFTVVRRSKPVFKVSPPTDEWGDEGVWETIVNFRDKHGRGMPADKVIKLFEAANAQGTKVHRKVATRSARKGARTTPAH